MADDLSISEKKMFMSSKAPSRLVRLTWTCDKTQFSLDVPTSENGEPEFSVWLLPDASGFICFETGRPTDNCVLLDASGIERKRLAVPWEMTARDIPLGAERWFRNVDGPYVNPATGKEGRFGVSTWIEYAGDYYFELDHETGKFLWAKPIRY